jgi:membrane-associated phospholipid phosphatase
LATADVVTDWNEAALDAIRIRGTPPPAAARNLAILHAAMFDAVNGIRRTHEPYLATGGVSPSASVDAAASTAAHHVLTTLYPNPLDQDAFDALHLSVLLTIPDGPARTAGIDWGADAAAQILDARADDGSTATGPWPGSEEPGQWRATISFGGVIRPALLPLWGQVTPFALPSGSLFRPPPPPGLRTRQYAAEVNHVKKLGELHSPARTPEQTEIAQFWGYGPGTATPPGHWNQIAQVVAADQDKTLEENARLFALLNIALADAGIVSWDSKYTYNYWRPITAIQLADTDGNSLTAPDPTWTPLLATPPFPEYTSGHSTFSGAAATVLALFYRRDRVAFSVGSDDLPGVSRSYRSFSQAAEESGVSRIYGGIHFPSANVRGLLTGVATGLFVFTHVLLPAR